MVVLWPMAIPDTQRYFVSVQKAAGHVYMPLRRTYCILSQSSGTADPPPAGEACWQMSDGWEKKAQVKRTAGLKYSKAELLIAQEQDCVRNPRGRPAGLNFLSAEILLNYRI